MSTLDGNESDLTKGKSEKRKKERKKWNSAPEKQRAHVNDNVVVLLKINIKMNKFNMISHFWLNCTSDRNRLARALNCSGFFSSEKKKK